MTQNKCHPIKPGRTVSIFVDDACGQTFLEGRAIVEAPGDQPHVYRVRFHGERILRHRFVKPDWQRVPPPSLQFLNQFRDTTALPSIDDFFPNHFANGEQS